MSCASRTSSGRRQISTYHASRSIRVTTLFSGRVTEAAVHHLAPGPYDFYLCGGRAMIRDFTVLADERFPGSRIFMEVFH